MSAVVSRFAGLIESADAEFRREGWVAVVTGGARGIGLGIAEALARRGAMVVIVDLDLSAAASAAAGFPATRAASRLMSQIAALSPA